MSVMALSLVIAALSITASRLPPQFDDLSRRAFRFFWEQSNKTTGLTLDRASNVSDDVPHPEEPAKYTVASTAATGYALCAYAVGADRGWIDRASAVERTRHTLQWLNDHGLKEKGWFYHFINWETGERVWKSEVSSIDTALLLAGVVMAQSEFHDPGIDAEATRLYNAIDWNWMLTNGDQMSDQKTFCMGWHPEDGFISARWDHYYENPFFNVIALGLDPQLPTETWSAFKRDHLNYKGYEFLNGGPIFIHEMGHDFIDMKGKRDSLGYDYWVSSRDEILATRQWCIDNPGGFVGYSADIWGLNACDKPDGYGACAGFHTGDDDGTLMPTCVAGALMFAPDKAKASIAAYRAKYPSAYGRYGFPNGINPTKNWTDQDVIGIDLGMMLLGIEDYRDGLPQRLMAANPIIQRGMQRAGFHSTKEGPLEYRRILAPQE
jgi:hypothetical protein